MLQRAHEWLADRVRSVQYPRVQRVRPTLEQREQAAFGAVKRAGLFVFGLWAMLFAIILGGVGLLLLWFVVELFLH